MTFYFIKILAHNIQSINRMQSMMNGKIYMIKQLLIVLKAVEIERLSCHHPQTNYQLIKKNLMTE